MVSGARVIAGCLALGFSVMGAMATAQPSQPSQPSQASSPSQAAVHFERGVTLFNVRNYEGALAEFQRSYQLSGRADLLFNIGRAYQSLGRYPEAVAAVEDYLQRSPTLPSERRAEVEAMLQELRGFIARIRVRVTPPTAELRVDGAIVTSQAALHGVPVSPSRHTIVASAPGYEQHLESVVVASGDQREVVITLTRPARVQPPSRTTVTAPTGTVSTAAPGQRDTARPGQSQSSSHGLPRGVFISTVAATGAFLIAGAIFGVMTSSTHDEFIQLTRDDPRAVTLAADGESYRTITNVSFGLAAAAGVASVILFTQTRWGSAAPRTTVSLVPTPSGAEASLRVSF